MTIHPVAEVFRSPRKADCDERAFVLTAVGIAGQVHFDGEQHCLTVGEPDLDAALFHLSRYAQESRPPPPPPAIPRPHAHSDLGCIAYVAVLLLVGNAVATGAWRLDAFEAGAVDSARIQAGQWWRAWTALTLHRDAAHLLANLGAGVWFGYLAGRQLGPGHAWLLTVAGGGLANLVEAMLGPPNHLSIGASTAVFTSLGLMAAYTWRTRLEWPQRWARRWGPLVAGTLLLGWLGTGGLSATDPPEVIAASKTDIVAHALGFGVGVALGAAAAAKRVRSAMGRVPQWASAVAAVGIVALAWSMALGS